MAVQISVERFEELVEDALNGVPEPLWGQVENCVVIVQDEPDPELGNLLGYYEGIPLSERTTQYSGVLPDRITIFQGPLCRMVDSEDALREQVRITVWHEIAHYFGISDLDLNSWGYG